jgi:hypothetical protein
MAALDMLFAGLSTFAHKIQAKVSLLTFSCDNS